MSRRTFAADYYESEVAIKRRTFLGRLVLAALGALGVAAIFPIRSLGPKPGRLTGGARLRSSSAGR